MSEPAWGHAPGQGCASMGGESPGSTMRWIARILLGMVLLFGRAATAEDRPLRASTQGLRPSLPAGLPRYEMDARLDAWARKVVARERVHVPNRSGVEVRELLLNGYPRYRVHE